MILKGKVVAKQRPRSSGSHFYTPTKTRQYENAIRVAYRLQDKVHHGKHPLRATIIFYKKNPTTKPDLDNVIKLLDALNGIAFDDDNQIVEIMARKIQGEEGLEIHLEKVDV